MVSLLLPLALLLHMILSLAVDTEEGGYHKVPEFAIGTKALAFALGVGYILVDYRKLGKGMTMTKKQREKREPGIEDPATDPLTRRTVLSAVTYGELGLLAAMVVTAWAVFVKYLI